jgi:hypothetical protein
VMLIHQQSDESSNYPTAEKITVKITGLGNGESVRSINLNELILFSFSDVDRTSLYGRHSDASAPAS